jgi:hypothetical protein
MDESQKIDEKKKSGTKENTFYDSFYRGETC